MISYIHHGKQMNHGLLIDIFNSLLLMPLSLALASKLPVGKLLIVSLPTSVSESDIKSNELKMHITIVPLIGH